MHPTIHAHVDEIRALCRARHVRRLDLIGSAARDEFDPGRSDVDFLVEFEPLGPGTAADTYFGLQEDLERLLGRRVDLVMTGAATNPYFRKTVDEMKVTLYAA
jgi:predicted nucleotidyltransferase